MKMQIWDLPTRLFHGLLILCVSFSYISGKINGLWLNWHIHCGVLILSALIFRIMWGFVGNDYARFSNFFPTPARLKKQYLQIWTEPGHSPLGALSVFAMLIMLSVQSCLGLFAMNDEIEIYGPLNPLVSASISKQVTQWHISMANGLLLLIGLHVTAVMYYNFYKRKNLIRPMMNGYVEVNPQQIKRQVHQGTKKSFGFAIFVAFVTFWLIESNSIVNWLINDELTTIETTNDW